MFILGILILVLDIWAVVSVFRSDADLLPKVLWAILIIGMPLFGLLLWYLLGPKPE